MSDRRSEAHGGSLRPAYGDAALARTESLWRDWSARSNYQGQWREAGHSDLTGRVNLVVRLFKRV